MNLDDLVNILIGYWLYDMSVFSNPWMYAPMGIPAMFYLMVFMLKWIVITAPIWLPITIIIKVFRGDKK